MDHYIDVKIKPDAEMQENLLLNSLYSKLHKALHDLKSHDIGVSFPEYHVKLGKLLRIHGHANTLKALQQTNWIAGLSGYCDISQISLIPEVKGYRTVSRVRTTMSASKLRRLKKRNTMSTSDIKNYKAKMFAQSLDNPYLELTSSCNGQKYRRYIKFGELVDQPQAGQFDYFGLSKTATIPWF